MSRLAILFHKWTTPPARLAVQPLARPATAAEQGVPQGGAATAAEQGQVRRALLLKAALVDAADAERGLGRVLGRNRELQERLGQGELDDPSLRAALVEARALKAHAVDLELALGITPTPEGSHV